MLPRWITENKSGTCVGGGGCQGSAFSALPLAGWPNEPQAQAFAHRQLLQSHRPGEEQPPPSRVESFALGCSSPGTPLLGAVTRVSICSAGICWMLSAAPSQLLKCPMTNPVADGESKGLSKYLERSGRKGLPASCPAFIHCCRLPVPCSVYPLQ